MLRRYTPPVSVRWAFNSVELFLGAQMHATGHACNEKRKMNSMHSGFSVR